MWRIIKMLFTESKEAVDNYVTEAERQMDYFYDQQQRRLGKISDAEMDRMLGLD